MKKYWQVARNTWEEILTYRLSFTMWRVRNVVILLSIYFLWYSVLPTNGQVFGYSRESMLTYILGTSLLLAIISSSRTYEIGEEINEGVLSNDLLRPVNYFLYKIAREIGDKAMNISFSVCELAILLIILRPPIFIQTNAFDLFFFVFAIILAVIMLFFINMIISFVGFWSPDYWAPRYIFWTLFTFLAGNLFPLDILPKTLFNIFNFLPFPYLLYFPLKIYLGGLSTEIIFRGIVVMMIWLIFFYFLTKIIWEKGLRNYTAAGR